MEIWDGYYRDGTNANFEIVRGKPIPDGIYHIVCDVLVRHIDGDYLLMQRDYSKPDYGGYYETTAGGSALKGEDKLACVKRELYEETGIKSDDFIEIGNNISDEKRCFYYSYLCTTDCDKNSIELQEGETMSYKWLNEDEFIRFINSENVIESQKERFIDYFREQKYL
jgi:8-oxo-dGTP pyrophosphatase MutT (NUDIX family)